MVMQIPYNLRKINFQLSLLLGIIWPLFISQPTVLVGNPISVVKGEVRIGLPVGSVANFRNVSIKSLSEAEKGLNVRVFSLNTEAFCWHVAARS